MVLPGVDRMTVADLEGFRPALLVVGIVIHAINSAVFGLIYGVLLPTLPPLPRPLAWGGLLMPMLWTALSFGLMGVVNPLLEQGGRLALVHRVAVRLRRGGRVGDLAVRGRCRRSRRGWSAASRAGWS